MPRVGIICDSTCDLEPSWLAQHNVRMVPLTIFFGEESYLDWVDLVPQEFYKKLATSSILPKTSQPSPAAFSQAYEELARDGCEEIVVITLSSVLSGTWQSASIASEGAPVPIRLVDSKKVSQGTGLVVKAAIEARDAGGDAEAVERAAVHALTTMRLYFVLDTLDYLVKGGRAGKAQGLAASLLNIKPVLEVDQDGVVAPFRKVKGQRKAMAEIAAHVAADASERGRMRLTVLHACNPALADALTHEIEAAGADVEIEGTGLVGAVIGTYAGPDAVGVAYHLIP